MNTKKYFTEREIIEAFNMGLIIAVLDKNEDEKKQMAQIFIDQIRNKILMMEMFNNKADGIQNPSQHKGTL